MPTIQLPETTGKECSHRPAYKVSCHKDGVDTVRSAGRKLEDTRLVTKLDALHTYINNDNAGNNTYICTFSHIKQQPGEKNQSAADKVEAAYTYLFTYLPTKDAVNAPATPQSPSSPITSLVAKNGACAILKARQDHMARREPKFSAARME